MSKRAHDGIKTRMVTVNWIINAHKILVTPIVLAMMWYFHNWSAAAFLYFGLHGAVWIRPAFPICCEQWILQRFLRGD